MAYASSFLFADGSVFKLLRVSKLVCSIDYRCPLSLLTHIILLLVMLSAVSLVASGDFI